MDALGWMTVGATLTAVSVTVREVLAIRVCRRRCASVLLADEQPYRGAPVGQCELRAGHDGLHELKRGSTVVRWSIGVSLVAQVFVPANLGRVRAAARAAVEEELDRG